MSGFQFFNAVVMILVGFGIVMGVAPFLTWGERKWSALAQDRLGPNRAGVVLGGQNITLNGLLHAVADGIKMVFKEDFAPAAASNRVLHHLAPAMALFPAMVTIAIIPMGGTIYLWGNPFKLQALSINAGILYILALGTFATYGPTLAGWVSGNKFGLLGSLRVSSQMISYEAGLGLSLVGVMMIFGSVSLDVIVRQQAGNWFGIIPKWGIFVQPLGALLFMVCALAETKRAPFDLPEGESEIIAGYFIEYSGLKFGMFFLGEFIEIVVLAALFTTLFLGGYHAPFVPAGKYTAYAPTVLIVCMGLLALLAMSVLSTGFRHPVGKAILGVWAASAIVVLFAAQFEAVMGQSYRSIALNLRQIISGLAQLHVFLVKVLFLCWFQIMVRWTYPRFRYDQVMNLGWKIVLPLALANLAVTGVVVLVID